MSYQAPVDDIMHALKTAAGLDELDRARRCSAGVDEDTIRAVIEEAGKFGAEVLDPLSAPGDRAGSKLVDGKVVTPPGWKEAYQQFAAGGWGALVGRRRNGAGRTCRRSSPPPPARSGTRPTWRFGLCPLLTFGAIDAIEAQGSDAAEADLPAQDGVGRMDRHHEPDRAARRLGPRAQLKTRAVKQADGSYRIVRHQDLHHLRRPRDDRQHHPSRAGPPARCAAGHARHLAVPGAQASASTRTARSARTTTWSAPASSTSSASTRSPTCVMKYGEKGEGAVGYLVGEENRGLNVMFIMMNAARLAVGMQGVAVAERATQRAHRLRQGAPAGPQRRQREAPTWRRSSSTPTSAAACMTMKALTQAARAICLVTAKETDVARRSQRRRRARRRRASRGAAHPGGQGVLHRHRLRGGLHRRAGARRHGLHRGDRRGAASIATHASCRSTRAPTASRPWTWSHASCRWKAARSSRTTSPISLHTVDGARLEPAGVRAHGGNAWARPWRLWPRPRAGSAARCERDPDSAMAAAAPYLRLFGLAAGGVLPGQGRARHPRATAPVAAMAAARATARRATARPMSPTPSPLPASLPRRWPRPRRGSAEHRRRRRRRHLAARPRRALSAHVNSTRPSRAGGNGLLASRASASCCCRLARAGEAPRGWRAPVQARGDPRYVAPDG